MSKKLTPWFPATVKPVRVGVYLREWPDNPQTDWYARWNGTFWGPSFTRMEKASNSGSSVGQFGLRWRGLAKEPK